MRHNGDRAAQVFNLPLETWQIRNPCLTKSICAGISYENDPMISTVWRSEPRTSQLQ